MSWCCMCRCSGETIDHLLLHYTDTMDLGALFLDHLEFNGFYRKRSSILCSVGKTDLESICRILGLLFHYI